MDYLNFPPIPEQHIG